LARKPGKLKLKTHKGAAKRFKLTATGKVLRGHAFARHILTSKASKRKRHLAQTATVDKADVPHIRRMLPYGKQ
jgi:large subunit ribosomal protein L35